MKNYDFCYKTRPVAKAVLPTKADIIVTCVVSLIGLGLVIFPTAFSA